MIRCLVVDDEPLAREAVITYITKMPELSLVDECENAIQAMSILRENHVDLIFLDIEMPEIDGISFLKYLKKNPGVIFTTAYRTFFDTYMGILRKRKNTPFGEEERNCKWRRNGKWLEYIAFKDRAVKMAQAAGIPPEVLIDLSFPPVVSF